MALVLHSISRMYSHSFMRGFSRQNFGNLKFFVILKTREEYVSTFYGHTRFTDSQGFMKMRLPKLVKTSKENDFGATEEVIW